MSVIARNEVTKFTRTFMGGHSSAVVESHETQILDNMLSRNKNTTAWKTFNQTNCPPLEGEVHRRWTGGGR